MKRKSSGKNISSSRLLDRFLLILIAVLVPGMILLNGKLFLDMVDQQADILGREQLETVSGRLRLMLSNAEIVLRRLAAESELLLSEELTEDEMLSRYEQLKADSVYSGCKNIFMAGEEWYVVPDFTVPEEGFVPKERVWYRGARKNGTGRTYISAPYLDVVTGSMCFTVSMLLEDEETVVGVDFGLDSLQETIVGVSGSGGDALVVSSSGQIVTYRDEAVVGMKLSEALPQYTAVFQRIAVSDEESMHFKTKISGTESTVFYSCTANEWYIISTVSNTGLNNGAYLRIISYSVLNVLITAVMIALYALSSSRLRRSEKNFVDREEYILQAAAELRAPLRTILRYCDNAAKTDTDEARKLLDAAVTLEHSLSGITAYKVSTGRISRHAEKKQEKRGDVISDNRNKLVMFGVLTALAVTMAVSVVLSTNAVIAGGNNRMRGDISSYASELNIWIAEQKSTLDMFSNSISANPSIKDDYEGAVKWLNDITSQYSGISVTYMSNADWDIQVIMNNRWQPEPGWRVEERPWYIETMSSEREDGFNISAPYYDDQTGLYCVTFSERVYDSRGNYICNFSADFYLDQLTQILSESYTDEGYAFLADRNGQIINHPNKAFELSADNAVSIEQAGYLDVLYAQDPVFITDYDGKRKAALSETEPMSRFNIIGVEDSFAVYGDVALYNILYFILFGICIGSIIYMLLRQMRWQKEANELLRESAEIAERAGNAKSQFLAQMSHEIRTPINAVLGMNEMILRESGDSGIREYSENIRNAGRTLLSLINSILDFSKIEDGKMEIVPVSYDTAYMINDLVNMIRDRAEKKGLEFITEIEPELPAAMYGDDVRVRQVITNLLTNAVKYTDSGKVWLRIGSNSAEGRNITLHVEVEDTGIGIKQEDMEGLFSSFRRLDLEKNRKVEGTGLGMTIVQKLLQMMGSELKVTSIYGEGSRFWFDIIQGIEDPEPIGDYTKRLAESRRSENEGMYVYAPFARVLIVDDNNMNLIVAKGLMKRSGIRVDTALSGSEGIRLASENFYDIIFLDHMMPDLDGIETLEIIKERGILQNGTSLIMMTANAIVGAREEYLRVGFDDYLSKPIDVKQLEKLLEQYIPVEKLSYKTKDGSFRAAEKPADSGHSAAATDKVSILDRLRLIPDLDIDAGMRYCMNDETFYLEMVKAYIGSSRLDVLSELYDSDEDNGYRAALSKVIKSSRSIGAMGIAAAARKTEDAIIANDPQLISETHKEFIKGYRRLIGSLSSALR